jgi:type IV secretion system protein VirB9
MNRLTARALALVVSTATGPLLLSGVPALAAPAPASTAQTAKAPVAAPASVAKPAVKPAVSTADDRLLVRPYSENEVVRIDGRAGVQATIAFGTGEAIENVAVGDSQTWQITPNKRADLLFVKPLDSTARTNMTVVTNRHTYFFDLVASAKAKPLYMLRFTYKDDPAPVAPAATTGMVPGAAMASLDPAEAALMAGDPSAVPAESAALNFAWKRTGTAKLLPSRVYDDGTSTYLLWPEKSPVPAILIQNEKGEEGPVNYAVRGSTIVVADVPRTIILRSGKSRAELENSRPVELRPSAVGVPVVAANTPSIAAQGN